MLTVKTASERRVASNKAMQSFLKISDCLVYIKDCFSLLMCHSVHLCRKLALAWQWTCWGNNATMTSLCHWQRHSLKAGRNSCQVQIFHSVHKWKEVFPKFNLRWIVFGGSAESTSNDTCVVSDNIIPDRDPTPYMAEVKKNFCQNLHCKLWPNCYT